MLGTGGVAGPMGEDGLDLGMDQDAGMGLEPDDELEGLGDEDELSLDGEEEGSLEVDKEQLRQLLDEVEMGNLSAEEAFEECCALKDTDDVSELGTEEGPEDLSDLGGEEENDLPMGKDEYSGGMYEDVSRIANMLTDDPDVFE